MWLDSLHDFSLAQFSFILETGEPQKEQCTKFTLKTYTNLGARQKQPDRGCHLLAHDTSELECEGKSTTVRVRLTL